MERFDVVVVGGRAAGAAAATHLARAGLSVLLLERVELPADTLSTHTVQELSIFERLGVLGAVERVGAPRMHRSTLWVDDLDLSADHPAQPWMSIRRITLDVLLADGARAAGAEVRYRCKVIGLLTRDGRVTGVRYRRADGRAASVACDLVVGADGRNSTIGRLVGARRYNVTWSERGAIWQYLTGVPAPAEFFFCRRGDALLLAAPCDHGRTLLAVQPDVDDCHPYREPGAVERAFVKDAAPWGRAGAQWLDLLAGGTREGPARMVRRYRCFFREAAGPGWVLLGDAGHVKDVTTGQGISDALRQAERLSGQVLPVWGDPIRVSAATRRWWRQRDRAAAPMYWLSQDMGRAGRVPPLFGAFLDRVADSERLKVELQEVLAQQRKVRQFTSTRRLAAVLAGALVRPGRLASRAALGPDGDPVRPFAEIRRTVGIELRRRWLNLRPEYEAPDDPHDELTRRFDVDGDSGDQRGDRSATPGGVPAHRPAGAAPVVAERPGQ